MLRRIKKIHIVGIGGIGLSSIAEILNARGFEVSGSDINLTEVTERLQALGIKVFQGHRAENIGDADAVVYTSALKGENPEVTAAQEKGIPAVKRPLLLAELMRGAYGLGIAGTHGKTTTTVMTGLILTEAGLDPTIIVGGKSDQLGGTNARAGKGEYLVLEADEYDRTFLALNPVGIVLTSMEHEHTDTYATFDEMKAAFAEFAGKPPFWGFTLYCVDDKHLRELAAGINGNLIAYGTSDEADLKAVDIKLENRGSEFAIERSGTVLGEVTLRVPGLYNVRNALAATGMALELGIPFEAVKKALYSFTGVKRRFEVKYDKEIMVVDDYAHHPSEAAAALAGVKAGFNRRVIAVFQPHLYSRTQAFAADFGKAFSDADIFVCTGVYPAREKPIEGVSGRLIIEAAAKNGHGNTIYCEEASEVPELLAELEQDGDIIITMGAGDIWKQGERFLQQTGRQP